MTAPVQAPFYPHQLLDVPYWPNVTLNTLDIYLPPVNSVSTINTQYWIIYIHGGAYRDPLITSTSILPSLNYLDPYSYPIAGVVSINYRLSPYPSHPTHPSSPTDESRNVKHPAHVSDVLTAIAWLQKKYHFRERYLLVGHSCGATLALQTVMHLWSARMPLDEHPTSDMELPVAIVAVEGIYNLQLLRDSHREYPIYQDFLQGAFGTEEAVWKRASPTQGEYGRTWKNGRVCVIAHSREDEQVDLSQAEKMLHTLKEEERDGRNDTFLELQGGHDDIWKDGKEMARAIKQALGWLSLCESEVDQGVPKEA